MILDIMDLRKDKWTPRRLENKPKMIKEIEEEVKNEEIVESMTSTTYQFKKKQRHNCVDKFAGGDVTNYRKCLYVLMYIDLIVLDKESLK